MPEGPSRDARIFFVDTRFQRMARRPGGIPRDRAIERAQSSIEEAKSGFDEWLEQELQELIVQVERVSAGTAEPDWLDGVIFSTHQLRDVGTTVGFELLTFIADSLLKIFEAAAAGAEYSWDSVACHMDALMLVKQRSYRNLKPEQLPELTSGLRRVSECIKSCSTCIVKEG